MSQPQNRYPFKTGRRRLSKIIYRHLRLHRNNSYEVNDAWHGKLVPSAEPIRLRCHSITTNQIERRKSNEWLLITIGEELVERESNEEVEDIAGVTDVMTSSVNKIDQSQSKDDGNRQSNSLKVDNLTEPGIDTNEGNKSQSILPTNFLTVDYLGPRIDQSRDTNDGNSQSDSSTSLLTVDDLERRRRSSSPSRFGSQSDSEVFNLYHEKRSSIMCHEAYARGRSYSQRYDICSSPRLTEICSPRGRSKTFSTIVEVSPASIRRSSLANSPAARRRRISVKSSALRKQSSRNSTPRQRRRTVGTYNPSTAQQYHVTCDGNLSSSIIPSRKLSVAVGRKPSNAFQKRPRRCSEPFLLDSINLHQDKWNRKHSISNRGKRRLSTAGILPASSKQKLQALAKDELLASLNVPLTTEADISVVDDEEDVDDLIDTESEIDDSDEKKAQLEKERKETKRLLIMEEILETEKNYISCLETLNAVFRSQLKDASIITEKDLNSLFPSHLQNIKESHTHFMRELEERMNNVDWRGIIGDIFAKMTSASMNLLEMYTAYVNSFPKAISTLSKCTRSSNKFRKFLEDCYENPVVERLDLPSFLLSPVQRLPRYILLLRELLKYTDEEHPDRYFISEAMIEMESLISSLNSSIHKSMEFYSASDSRRKKMSRSLTSKKRKQRASSTILRSNKNLKSLSENKSDNDQGYCSFGERKDESPEDETATTTGRKARSSTWRANGKRSMSMVSNTSDDSNKPIMRRKQELALGRNTDTRKSWRRSIGAVFSHLWSANREIDDFPRINSKEDVSMDTTNLSLDLSGFNGRGGSLDNLDGVPTNSTPSRRKSSSSKRKVAITHSISSPTFENMERLSPMVEVLDGNENIQEIDTLVRNTTINDDDDDDVTPPLMTSAPLSTGETELSSCITSDDERKNSTVSEVSNASSTLKTPGSPQNFRRGGRLRGSAGPVFKSIFQKNSTKMQKTVSMDALNEKFVHEEKKKRSLKKRTKDTIHHKSACAISHHQSPPPTENFALVKSLSSYMISQHGKDNRSVSSTETISSKTSGSVKGDDNEYVINDNNNTTAFKQKSERKSKIFKTLKSFVGKK